MTAKLDRLFDFVGCISNETKIDSMPLALIALCTMCTRTLSLLCAMAYFDR